eukprot:3934580-Rhodomonas_salina.1
MDHRKIVHSIRCKAHHVPPSIACTHSWSGCQQPPDLVGRSIGSGSPVQADGNVHPPHTGAVRKTGWFALLPIALVVRSARRTAGLALAKPQPHAPLSVPEAQVEVLFSELRLRRVCEVEDDRGAARHRRNLRVLVRLDDVGIRELESDVHPGIVLDEVNRVKARVAVLACQRSGSVQTRRGHVHGNGVGAPVVPHPAQENRVFQCSFLEICGFRQERGSLARINLVPEGIVVDPGPLPPTRCNEVFSSKDDWNRRVVGSNCAGSKRLNHRGRVKRVPLIRRWRYTARTSHHTGVPSKRRFRNTAEPVGGISVELADQRIRVIVVPSLELCRPALHTGVASVQTDEHLRLEDCVPSRFEPKGGCTPRSARPSRTTGAFCGRELEGADTDVRFWCEEQARQSRRVPGSGVPCWEGPAGGSDYDRLRVDPVDKPTVVRQRRDLWLRDVEQVVDFVHKVEPVESNRSVVSLRGSIQPWSNAPNRTASVFNALKVSWREDGIAPREDSTSERVKRSLAVRLPRDNRKKGTPSGGQVEQPESSEGDRMRHAILGERQLSARAMHAGAD